MATWSGESPPFPLRCSKGCQAHSPTLYTLSRPTTTTIPTQHQEGQVPFKSSPKKVPQSILQLHPKQMKNKEEEKGRDRPALDPPAPPSPPHVNLIHRSQVKETPMFHPQVILPSQHFPSHVDQTPSDFAQENRFLEQKNHLLARIQQNNSDQSHLSHTQEHKLGEQRRLLLSQSQEEPPTIQPNNHQKTLLKAFTNLRARGWLAVNFNFYAPARGRDQTPPPSLSMTLLPPFASSRIRLHVSKTKERW